MRPRLGLVAAIAMVWGGAAFGCTVEPWYDTAMPETLIQIERASGYTPGPVAAWFDAPTTRYPHGVLGDTVEAGALVAMLDDFPNCLTGRVDLPDTEVFEDLAPRLADLNGDGHAEIIVVQSSATTGARLVIYGLTPDGEDITVYGETPPIGRPNRWLAPIGVADFNGDGLQDVAYIDRPHLARTLRVWTAEPAGLALVELTEIASLGGLTNHRIGEDFITGGVRDCGTGPEMITADTGWRQVMATRLTPDGALETRPIGAFSQTEVAEALACTR